MKQIFVDTNGWVALNSQRDAFYEEAKKLNKDFLEKGFEYITTNFVLDETYTWLTMKAGHSIAVDFGEKIRKSKITHIFRITEEIEEEAWDLFKQYSDKKFSFTDCTSFVVMQQMNIEKAFTNDRHFEQMRFTALLKK